MTLFWTDGRTMIFIFETLKYHVNLWEIQVIYVMVILMHVYGMLYDVDFLYLMIICGATRKSYN
jgi:hypothetical protein